MYLGATEVNHVVQLGWNSAKNGKLLALAESEGYAVLVTKDTSMQYEQNLKGRTISIVVLRPASQYRSDALALGAKVLIALESLRPASVTIVSYR